MDLHLTLFTHNLPLWFLVLSLFLPRISLFVAWLQAGGAHGHTIVVPIIPLIMAVLIPRILILIMIYTDQGLSLWFLIHLIALLIAWGGGGHRVVYRDRYIRER
jgi:hypothetical protein